MSVSCDAVMKLSDYVEGLPKVEKERYIEKLGKIKCDLDPYLDESFIACSENDLPIIKYSDIYDYLICSSNLSSCEGKPGNAFKSLDSFRMVCTEGWLSSLRWKKWSSAVVIIADVKPSQRSGVLYKTWVGVRENGEVSSAHCTCMAGLSEVCNHVGAVLYKCMQQASEPQSSTSLPNQWLPAKKSVAPVPIKDVKFGLSKVDKCQSTVKPAKRVKQSAKDPSALQLNELTESDQEDLFEQLSTLDYNPVILSVHRNFNKPFIPLSQKFQFPPTITSFYDPKKETMSYDELITIAENTKRTYDITSDQIIKLEESTKLQAKCKLWENHRAGRITASNLKAVVCTSADNPAKSLIKKLCYPEACKFSSAATAWGCQHEEDAIQEFLDQFYLEHSDVTFNRCGLRLNRSYPFMGASPDGIVSCSCHQKSLIEVKCPYSCSKLSLEDFAEGKKGSCLQQVDGGLKLDKSHSYYYQIQCQLNICEFQLCYFVVWSPEELHVEEINRDARFFAELLPAVDRFLVKGILPEIIGRWYTRQSVIRPTSESDAAAIPTGSVGELDVITSGNDVNFTSTTKEVYCICNGIDDGRRMVMCEDENCKSGTWFHFECINLTRKPRGKWYCPDCKARKGLQK